MDDESADELVAPAEDRELAMQVRCPRCLGEQYALNVLPFSHGESGCTVCGHLTEPMTYGEWQGALRLSRRANAIALSERLSDPAAPDRPDTGG